MLNEESVGLQPSLALKFLIDGRRSDNLLAAVSVKPVEGLWDFFGETMKNRLEPFDQTENGPDWIEVQTVQRKLLEGSNRPFATGVSHLARKDAEGNSFRLKDVVTPYQLEFKAVPAVQNLNDEQNPLEWYKPLMDNIDAGDDLFEVWAWSEPKDCGGVYEQIATIKLQTKLHTSIKGDERLYFQHRRVMGDRRLWDKCAKEEVITDPEFDKTEKWTHGPRDIYDYWPSDRQDAHDEYLQQVIDNDGCPFAWLLEDL